MPLLCFIYLICRWLFPCRDIAELVEYNRDRRSAAINMMELITLAAAQAIAKIAFDKFVEDGAGKLGKNMTITISEKVFFPSKAGGY